MGLRELLMLVGVVIIVAVAFDAFRRIRNESPHSPLHDPLLPEEEEEAFSEKLTQEVFPNGGARRKSLKETLTSSVAENHASRQEPQLGQGSGQQTSSLIEPVTAQSQSIEHDFKEPLLSDEMSSANLELNEPTQQALKVEEVIVLNITAKPGAIFQGTELIPQLLKNGLRHGDMKVFHYLENNARGYQKLFSVANLVEPGTLDIAQIETITTPGICLFLSLPGPSRPLQAFDRMLVTARNIAQHLGGDLRDENRSIMTNQTIQHTRQRVIDYERKKMMRNQFAVS